MPYIRAVLDWQTPQQREVWLRITEHQIDYTTGYLTLFRLHFTDGSSKDYHLYRRDISLFDVATTIFSAMTTLRSAKGLLEDLNKSAGKLNWKGKASVAGLAIGSAALLYEFFQSRPFQQEGYYDGAGNLFLGRTINTRDANDYDPRDYIPN